MEYLVPNGSDGKWITLYVNMEKYKANPKLKAALVPKHLQVLDEQLLPANNTSCVQNVKKWFDC
jgi:hypothetical protein